MTLRDLITSSRTDGKKEVHEAAHFIGCSWKTLDNYLLGRTSAGPKILKKLAEFLSVEPGEVPKKISSKLIGVKPKGTGKLAEVTVEYRVKPNFQAGILLRSQSTDQLIDAMAGLLKDRGVAVDDRINSADLLFDEIRRRFKSESSATSDSRVQATVAAALETAAAALPKRDDEVPR